MITPSLSNNPFVFCVQVDNPSYSNIAWQNLGGQNWLEQWAYDANNPGNTNNPYVYSTNCNCATSVNENESVDRFSIYPNPTNGELTIALEKVSGKIPYSIYDQQGRMVKSGTLDGNKTQIRADLNDGLYYLKAGEQVVKVQVLK
jgi:hypothetical protein